MTTTGSYAPSLLELLINGIAPLNISDGNTEETRFTLEPLNISDGTTQQTYIGIQPLNIVINRQFIYAPPPIRVTVGNFNINRIRINARNTTYPRIRISPLPPKS